MVAVLGGYSGDQHTLTHSERQSTSTHSVAAEKIPLARQIKIHSRERHRGIGVYISLAGHCESTRFLIGSGSSANFKKKSLEVFKKVFERFPAVLLISPKLATKFVRAAKCSSSQIARSSMNTIRF